MKREKKDEAINVRVTSTFRDLVRSLAKAEGLLEADYIRMLLAASIRERAEEMDIDVSKVSFPVEPPRRTVAPEDVLHRHIVQEG